jgi:hypothetical protein
LVPDVRHDFAFADIIKRKVEVDVHQRPSDGVVHEICKGIGLPVFFVALVDAEHNLGLGFGLCLKLKLVLAVDVLPRIIFAGFKGES